MDWIEIKGDAPFIAFKAVQSDGHLSSHLANERDVDDAVAELKRQIDLVAKRMKLKLQSNA
jgi:hypothetical protein